MILSPRAYQLCCFLCSLRFSDLKSKPTAVRSVLLALSVSGCTTNPGLVGLWVPTQVCPIQRQHRHILCICRGDAGPQNMRGHRPNTHRPSVPEEPLHVYISADNQAAVDQAAELIQKILEPPPQPAAITSAANGSAAAAAGAGAAPAASVDGPSSPADAQAGGAAAAAAAAATVRAKLGAAGGAAAAGSGVNGAASAAGGAGGEWQWSKGAAQAGEGDAGAAAAADGAINACQISALYGVLFWPIGLAYCECPHSIISRT